VGFPRCGTSSFTAMTGIEAHEDMIYDLDSAQRFSKEFPIIITRDDKKAQAYSHFCRNKKMSGETRDFSTQAVYEEYLDKCDYDVFIAPWKTLYPNLVIYTLEELQADPDFVKVTDYWTDPHDLNTDITQAVRDSMDTYIQG
jgi:hypothetical protein